MNNHRDIQTILLIDDDHSVRQILAHALEDYQVDAFAGRREACQFVEKNESYVADLIISDFNLGNDNGIEAIRELRPYFSAVRTILMSGSVTGDLHTLAQSYGIDRFLEKPFPLQTLLSTVAELIGKPASVNKPVYNSVEALLI